MRDLDTYAALRDALLARIVETLAADPGVVAAWLTGSFGRGAADAWSDLDLHLAIEDEAFPAFWQERERLYNAIAAPVLVQREMPSNAQHGGHFQLVIFPGPVEVDWNIGPVSLARRPVESHILLARQEIPIESPPKLDPDTRRERASDALTFFWAMAPIAVNYAGRGHSRKASAQIDLLTGAYIPLWRLVHSPEEPDPFASSDNRALEPALDGAMPQLGREITPEAALTVIRDICDGLESMHPALATIGVLIPDAMPDEVRTLVDIAAAELARDAEPARRGT